MSVYVDQERYRYRRMIMCHMFADTITELHDMADRIGVNRKWFQNHKTPHYDICLAKRKLVIQNGAIEIDRRKAYDLIKKYRWRKGCSVFICGIWL